MGFLNGRVTFVRYRVGGVRPLPFSPEILKEIERHAFGRHGAAETSDGVSFGWSGGDHVLDLGFDPAKNLLNDALHLAIRIDADRIPGPLLRAYSQMELEALAAQNPSGTPTRAQRQEAKERARLRAEAEAADGRFRRMNHTPVLWDGLANVLYAGTTSAKALERLQQLFRETFDRPLEPLTAGSLALGTEGTDFGAPDALAEASISLLGGEDAELSTVAWAANSPNMLDHLGNEFLVWLWHRLQNESDTIRLGDASEVAVMMARTLSLDCPRGENGRDCLTDDSPTRLPEAFRALQSGKLPRKVGLVLLRQGAQYELTLQAETLAVSGGVLPPPEHDGLSESERKAARIDSLRHLSETIDLLFDAYCRRRGSKSWPTEVSRIRRWLSAA